MTPAKNRDHRSPNTTGVLLTNTGTPDSPTAPALRRFLAQFLSDRRVIETARWLWLPILHGVILNTRPRRSARLYQRIWTPQGSPLLLTTQRLAEGIYQALQSINDLPIKVAIGMRYGSPSIADGLRSLREQGAGRILVFPLFPQYSATTTASALDAVFAELKTWRALPELRTRTGYHDHPAYIHALITEHTRAPGEIRDARPLAVFVPRHTRKLRSGRRSISSAVPHDRSPGCEHLGLADSSWQVSYQSRFGPQTWLGPSTDETLAEWGAAGMRRVSVVCPGFSADCLETLYEIDIEARKVFLEAGGSHFSYIPALNDHPAHIQALTDVIQSDLSGWVDSEHSDNEPQGIGSYSTAQEVNNRVSVN